MDAEKALITLQLFLLCSDCSESQSGLSAWNGCGMDAWPWGGKERGLCDSSLLPKTTHRSMTPAGLHQACLQQAGPRPNMTLLEEKNYRFHLQMRKWRLRGIKKLTQWAQLEERMAEMGAWSV